MTSNKNYPAFPADAKQIGMNGSGLTKREYMASQIMAGIRAGKYQSPQHGPLGPRLLMSSKEAASLAIEDADELLKQLEK